MGKVSGKKHTKEQLDHWANLYNPNNKEYQTDHANQVHVSRRSHQRIHNANRRSKEHWMPEWEWAPDYPEYDD